MSQDGVNPEGLGDDQPQSPAGDAAGDAQTAGLGGETNSDAPQPEMAAFEADLGEDSQLAQTLTELEEARDELARARAETYNVKQEYGNYVRRTRAEAAQHRQNGQVEVVEAILPVLDDIDAARAAGDLADGPFAAIAAKLEATLGAQFQLESYGEEGDSFDPNFHEALMAATNPEVAEPTVKQVLQPGYRVGDRVLRATKVIVDNPA